MAIKSPSQKARVVLKNCTLVTKAKTDPIAKANLDAFYELVDMLLDQPDQILYVHARVKSGKLSDSSPSSWSTPEAWPEDPQTFGGIPKYWLWQLVRNIEPKFTPDFIENLESNNRAVIRHLVEYAFLLDTRAKLPQGAKDPLVLARVLTTRGVLYGDRLKGFPDKEGVCKEQGTIDWKKAGPYKLGMFNSDDPAHVTKLTYLSGDSVGPPA